MSILGLPYLPKIWTKIMLDKIIEYCICFVKYILQVGFHITQAMIELFPLLASLMAGWGGVQKLGTIQKLRNPLRGGGMSTKDYRYDAIRLLITIYKW